MNGNTKKIEPGLPAREFEKIFREAKVLADGLDVAKSAASKATRMGKFLTPNIGREVTISVNGRAGKAKLCMSLGRAKQKLYYFEVRWDEPNAEDADTTGPPAHVELDDGLNTSRGTDVAVAGNVPVVASNAEPALDPLTGGGGDGNEEQW